MRTALLQEIYGDPQLLKRVELPIPEVGDRNVLVQVHAAALHVGDVFSLRGKPWLVRLATGLFKPTCGIPGYDLAGTVSQVGAGVTRFNVGDLVFGECQGSCATHVAAPEDHLAHKPEKLSFEQAAAIPTSAMTALHALDKTAELKPGQRLLINGASGGVGIYAVQIGKILGAHVTGVCSTKNVDLVQELGADDVVDYTQSDVCQVQQPFDVIFDNVENRSLAELRNILTPTGTLVLNSGTGAAGFRLLMRILKPLILSPFVQHKLARFVITPNHHDLSRLAVWVDAGQLTPVLDEPIRALDEVPEALRYIETGRARGKVVVRIAGNDNVVNEAL